MLLINIGGHMRFLITGFYFDGFHGSVMHILEIAKGLSNNGHNVTIVSQIVKNGVKKQLVQGSNITVLSVSEVNTQMHFDFALCYHFPVLPSIVSKGVTIDKIMFGCLSGFAPIELLPKIAAKNVFYIQSHSEELATQLVSEHHLSSEKILVVPNCVSDNYFRNYNYQPNASLKSVAIVSNHVPQEIREAIKHLKTKGIKCTVYGEEDRYIPISPEILIKYDCIISIGKTVQYALALGIPIFEYDRFGGSGYITKDNVEQEENFNFSGRATKRIIEGVSIADELVNGYESIKKDLIYLKSYAIKYKVSSEISKYYGNCKYYLPFDCNDEELYSFTKEQFSFFYDSICKFKSFPYKLGKSMLFIASHIIPRRTQNKIKKHFLADEQL